jgi:hypothetical protein
VGTILTKEQQAKIGFVNPAEKTHLDEKNRVRGTTLAGNWMVPIPVDKKNYFMVVIFKNSAGEVQFIRVMERQLTKVLEEEVYPDMSDVTAVFAKLRERVLRRLAKG